MRSTFSADPRVVAECGAYFVEGLSRHKILACAKHFPGLGGMPPAPRRGLAISGRSMAELWRSDLVPYRELLPRLPLVLMSAAAHKAYDSDHPRSAVLSTQVVEALLRAKLGYRGVVVASQLESQPVRGGLDVGRAAVQSLNAGCDMLLVEKDESWRGHAARDRGGACKRRTPARAAGALRGAHSRCEKRMGPAERPVSEKTVGPAGATV